MFKLLLFLIVAYIVVCAGAFIFQRKLIFFTFGEPVPAPIKMGIEAKKVKIPVSDGVVLIGYWASKGDSPYTLLWCHGNAGTIGDRIGEFKRFIQAGINVFLFDYRGYGESTGSPSADGIKEDAIAVYEYLVKQGVEWHTIVPYGRSLGSGPAAYLANQRDVGGLILVQPITSTLEMGKHAYPYLPVGLLLREIIDNEAEMNRYDGPLLVVHGEQDDVVPFAMGEKLYNTARSRQKTLVPIPGADHNNLGITHFNALKEAIQEFLNSLN
jgi:fermentation-respiration switch protein FrsA (DUF1100 family)